MNQKPEHPLCIPGRWIVTGQLNDALSALTAMAGRSFSTAEALWFTRAAWLYHQQSNDPDAWRQTLLPAIRQAAQDFISAQPPKMNDGGLLVDTESGLSGVALNALWYNMLMILATELKGEPAADHFDRLAGRFRRSFLKLYWQGDMLGEQGCSESPDGSQLLAATLPHSAVPRTKQRQLVTVVAQRLAAEAPVLHRIWLAEAVWIVGEKSATACNEARTIMTKVAAGTLDETAQAESARVLHLLSA